MKNSLSKEETYSNSHLRHPIDLFGEKVFGYMQSRITLSLQFLMQTFQDTKSGILDGN